MPRALPPSKANLGLWTPGYRQKWTADPHWRRLPRTAKALYTQIIEQPGISRAGTLHLDLQSLAEQHTDATDEEIRADFDALVAGEYLISIGSWVFARTWFRYNRNTRNINHLRPILADIEAVGRQEMRDYVISALFASLTDAAREGETFAPEVVNACLGFATKWDLTVPDVLRGAAKRPTSRTSSRDAA